MKKSKFKLYAVPKDKRGDGAKYIAWYKSLKACTIRATELNKTHAIMIERL